MGTMVTGREDDQDPVTIEYEDRVAVNVWRSELDGVLVVQVDTAGGGERIRINLNEAPVWDGNPNTDPRPGAFFKEEE